LEVRRKIAAVKLEFQEALRGVKKPLGPHHRAVMVLVAFLLMYVLLWVLYLTYSGKHLYLTYSGKHYVLLVPVALLALAAGTKAARLLRIAVLSPSKST
jgi:hypothetical protein